MCLGALLVIAPLSIAYAQRVSASRDTPIAATPDGRTIATLTSGAAVTSDAVKGAWTRITLDGWLAKSLVGAARDSFDVTAGAHGARLRADANDKSSVIASLLRGMGMHVVAKGDAWIHVRRSAWVRTSALSVPNDKAAVAKPVVKSAPTSAPPPAAATTKSSATPQASAPPKAAASPQPPAAPDSAVTPTHGIAMMSAPDGKSISTLAPGAVAIPVARDRDWVKVRVEGWVRARDLTAADPASRTLSAADLRGDPNGTRGRILRWTIQKLQFMTGDGLRSDIAVDEPYLLARGPGDENALLYVTVPPDLVAQARALAPMSTVTITARVRTGRSEPSGVPVLELRAIEH